MGLEGIGREIAEGLHRAAAFQQGLALGDNPLQFDRFHLRTILFPLELALRLFVVVELALNAGGGTVKEIADDCAQGGEVEFIDEEINDTRLSSPIQSPSHSEKSVI